jgi:7-keto-8-aminopelargonate synthetase-like enzyme
MLGAAVGSARLHLSEEFPALQAELRARLVRGQEEIARTGLELSTLELSPIFQAQCPSPRVAFNVAGRLRARGFYCCVCVFPAVPMNRPGIRFTITRHNALEDIGPFVSGLRDSIAEAVAALPRGQVDKAAELDGRVT